MLGGSRTTYSECRSDENTWSVSRVPSCTSFAQDPAASIPLGVAAALKRSGRKGALCSSKIEPLRAEAARAASRAFLAISTTSSSEWRNGICFGCTWCGGAEPGKRTPLVGTRRAPICSASSFDIMTWASSRPASRTGCSDRQRPCGFLLLRSWPRR